MSGMLVLWAYVIAENVLTPSESRSSKKQEISTAIYTCAINFWFWEQCSSHTTDFTSEKKKYIYIYELLLCFPPLFLCHFCISCHTDFKIRLKKKSLRSDHCWTRLLYLLLFLLIEPQVIWDSGCKQLNWWLGRKANRWIQQGVFFIM